MAALLLRLPSSNGSAPLRHFPAVRRNASRPFASSAPRLRPRAASASTLSSMETPPDGYRKNVGICLVNPSNKIFAASRLDVPDSWQMPQGGIDNDEDPITAAVRELREETGVISAEVLAEVPYWLTYDFPPEVKEKVNNLWGTNWKGQAQKWFLLRFTGKDEEINLAGDGTEAAEFGEWSWLQPQEIIDRVGTNSFFFNRLICRMGYDRSLAFVLGRGGVPDLLHRGTSGTSSYFPVRNSMRPTHWKFGWFTSSPGRNKRVRCSEGTK